GASRLGGLVGPSGARRIRAGGIAPARRHPSLLRAPLPGLSLCPVRPNRESHDEPVDPRDPGRREVPAAPAPQTPRATWEGESREDACGPIACMLREPPAAIEPSWARSFS